MKLDNNCAYLKIKDITPWHGDVFDHPEYEYYCTLKDKTLSFGIIHCRKCVNYSQKETTKDDTRRS